MKKKMVNIKIQKSKIKNQNKMQRTGSKSGISDKFKSAASKTVKENQVVYRSDNKRVKSPLYTNEEIGKIEIVKDFLPAPEELVLKDTNIKVTLNLSKTSVDFFKALAQKNKSQYQKVIRNLLDKYTQNFTGQC